MLEDGICLGETKPTICDVCGRNLTVNGITMTATEIFLKDYTNSYIEIQRVKDTFGKTKFSVCFTCYLKALGIRPIKKESK